MAAPIFKNSQWSVTDFGLEANRGATLPNIKGATPTYEIAAKRLLESTTRGAAIFYDWPVHMAEKTWVDIEVFIEAFDAALKAHASQYKGNVDPEILRTSYLLARRQAVGGR